MKLSRRFLIVGIVEVLIGLIPTPTSHTPGSVFCYLVAVACFIAFFVAKKDEKGESK